MRPQLFVVVGLMACVTTSTPAPTVAKPEAEAAPAPTGWQHPPAPAAWPEARWEEPPTAERTLRSGLRVVVVERHERPQVSVRLVFPTGTTSEGAERAGVTWLALGVLEDRFERRNAENILLESDEKSARRQLLLKGGALSFGVGLDASWLSVDGFGVDLPLYLKSLEAVVRERRHGQDGFGARRDGLLDAVEDVEVYDFRALGELLAGEAFGPGHPYGVRTIGTVASLSKLGMEDVVQRQDALLTPRGATLLVVGDVAAAEVLELSGRVFGGWTGEAPPATGRVTVSPRRRSRVLGLRRLPASTTQTCLASALPADAVKDAALEVLAESLRGTLNRALREEAGLTYGVQADVLRLRVASLLAVCVALPTSRTAEGVRLLFTQLERARASPEDLGRARAVLRTRRQLARADTARLVALHTEALGTRRPTALAEEDRLFEKATDEVVAGLAKRVLDPALLQVVMSGDPAAIADAAKVSRLGPVKMLTHALQ